MILVDKGEMKMLMWYIILLILIFSTTAGLVYLGAKVADFSKIKQISHNNKKIGFGYGLLIVAAFFGIAVLSINMMNAVICMLHFVIFWLICDVAAAIVRRIRKKEAKKNYAGAAALIFGIAYLAFGWYSAHGVWTTHYTIETEKDVKNLRVALIADSHIGTTFDGKGFAKHLKKIEKENPDILIIAGDFVDDGTSRKDMLTATKALGDFSTKYGIYFAFGNHDKGYYNPAKRGFTGADLVRELERNGVKVLEDETDEITENMQVIGRKDASEFMRGGRRMAMRELLENMPKNNFMLVVDHQPNDYKNQAESEVDLVLSGHTHGGQLFPLNKVGEWIGANDRTYGFEHRNLTDFIVTSGISDWAIKFKTGTKSEFVIIDIRKKTRGN